jgi:carboxyl-terminal processing protease
MQKYTKYIPGSSFFWGVLCGILVLWSMMVTIVPFNNILSSSHDWYLAEDTITIDQTNQAMKEIYSLIRRQYYTTWDIDQSQMARQALSAFVDGLWDPFSSYLPPVEWKQLSDAIDGQESIEGIGAVLSKKQGGVLVEEIIKSSPAALAGIKPLDMIVKVNGTWISQLSIWQIVDQIRGTGWTVVNLTIARSVSGVLDIIEKNITRDTIVIPSVSSKILTGPWGQKLWYIAISLFAQDTDERLNQEIAKILTSAPSGVILDLRWNGGGLLPESVDIASHFLKRWTPIVKVKYRLYNDDTYKSQWDETLINTPVVILIDWMTASASEIITLAIKQWRCKNPPSDTIWARDSLLTKDCDVILLWEKSFGKWSIQNFQELRFGWSLKLTVGNRYAPSWLSINHIGIDPDILLPFDKERYQKNSLDNQLEKAKTILSQYTR